MKKKIIIFICIIILFLIIAGSFVLLNNSSNKNENNGNQKVTENIQVENTSTENASNIEKEVKSMKVIINNKEYDVELDNNATTNDILNNLPLELDIQRYAGHEYYDELPFKPVFDENRTSNIKAGHIYYWDGWNAFVINFEDYDITPYKVVHIGEIKDNSVIELLENGDNNISIKVEK